MRVVNVRGMRRLASAFLIVLVLAACGGGDGQAGSGGDGGLPAAPDFTLELADGGTFTLSEEPRPSYLVFWAEW